MKNIPVETITPNEEGCPLDPVTVLYDMVRDRAYELSYQRGLVPGHESEDWLRAEREVLTGTAARVDETGNGYRIHMHLPDFEASQIRVGAAPSKIVIDARRESGGATLSVTDVFRGLELNRPIDIKGVRATFQTGVLDVTVPVASAAAEPAQAA